MNLKLMSLTLQNFKGIKDFTFNPQGQNVLVKGRNAAGKTTLQDAFTFLLFGKDSTGRSPENKGFQLKTRTKAGEPIHNLEHSVRGVFEQDGKPLVLKAVFTEKWTAPRGSISKELKGHETKYFVNEAPMKEGEYRAFIASIVDEEQFRLITDPAYFNQLDWQKRRDIILKLCAEISDADVFVKNPDLEVSRTLIEEHGPDKAKAILMERRKGFKDKLDQIPARIDEQNINLEAPAETVNIDVLKATKTELEEQKKTVEAQVKDAGKTAMEEKNRVYAQINTVTAQLNKNKELRRTAEHERQVLKDGLKRFDTRITQATESIADIETRIAGLSNDILAKVKERDDLADDWKEVKGRMTSADIEHNCPTCGQELPPDQVEQKRAEVSKRLADKQASDMKAIEDKGDALNTEIERLKMRISELEKHKENQVEIIEKAARERDAEMVQVDTPLPDYSANNEMLEAQLTKLREEADKPVEAVDTSGMEAEIKEIEERITDINRIVANADSYDRAQRRIKELLAEESKLGAELTVIEGQILAVEKFIVTKADMQEGAINNMFKNVTFRLFDRQVNGGINPTFVTLINGVAYPDANTAAQINSGLEIIEYLCDAYDANVPCFVDHAESVTDLYQIKSQVVALQVSKEHRTLTMEVM